MLVALLQEDPALAVDQHDAGEGATARVRDERVVRDPLPQHRCDERRGAHELDVGQRVALDEHHLTSLVALDLAQRRARDEGVEMERAAIGGDQLEAAEVGEVLGGELDTGLLGQLTHSTDDGLLTVLEPATREAPHLRPHRRVLVALLHQHPAARVDQGDLDEVGADEGGLGHPSTLARPHIRTR